MLSTAAVERLIAQREHTELHCIVCRGIVPPEARDSISVIVRFNKRVLSLRAGALLVRAFPRQRRLVVPLATAAASPGGLCWAGQAPVENTAAMMVAVA